MTIKKVSGVIVKIDNNNFKFVPDNDFNNGTKYFINLTDNIKNNNNSSLIPFNSSFIVDNPFFVESSIPQNNALNIPVDSSVQVTFNRDILDSSINDNFKLVYFEPFAVKSVIPENNSINILVDQIITIEFNDNINISTLNINNIYLETNLSKVLTSFSTNNNEITIVPNEELLTGTNYKIIITTNLKSINDEILLNEFESSFTTILQDTIDSDLTIDSDITL